MNDKWNGNGYDIQYHSNDLALNGRTRDKMIAIF